jgi:hypothetical protein
MAQQILGCDSLTVANLVSVPTQNLRELGMIAGDGQVWHESRPQLEEALNGADDVLLAWGLGGIPGSANRHFLDQTAWVRDVLSAKPAVRVWSIQGETRHPSRWHQYVSERHGRTAGGDFMDRLTEVLTRVADPA